MTSLTNIGEEDITDTWVSALSERISAMVYVMSKTGKPLMPTERHGKVRRLLKSGKARVVRRTPFTIQLLYETTEYVQPVTLGIDPGYQNVGLSAVTDQKEVFRAEAKVRTDIPGLLSRRRQYRRSRRHRKTRYREPRFDNRVHSKHKGWLAPSVESKIDGHMKLIKLVCSILPVSSIRIETAQFDIQKLENPDVKEKDYQQGEQAGFWNVREYVLWRDNHTCQRCKDRSRDAVLEIHHLESRKTGSNRPGNLITLCKTCHDKYHTEGFDLPKPGRGFRAEAYVNIMRFELYQRASELDIPVSVVYGYQTKYQRHLSGIAKSHASDAFVIAGGAVQVRASEQFQFRQVRKQNRKLYKGIRSHIRSKADRILFGFHRWDKVQYRGGDYFIKGRRSSGYFSLSDITGRTATLDGKKLDSVRYSQLALVERATTLLGRREAVFFPDLTVGVSCR
jgi:N6-L-threonylcarbamoyladenine synthase